MRPRCSASTNNKATTEKKTASLILTCRSSSSLLGTECGRRLSPFVFLEGEGCTQARNTENLGLPDITTSCYAPASEGTPSSLCASPLSAFFPAGGIDYPASSIKH